MKLMTMLNISAEEFDSRSVILAHAASPFYEFLCLYKHIEGIMTVSLSIIIRTKGDEGKKKLA